MDKTYKSDVVRREPRPRSKRLRESGMSVAGNVSITVNNNGEGSGTGSENGHIHSNFSMLESLSADEANYVYRTIPVDGEDDLVTQQTEKIRAGFADKAGELDEKFITDVLRKLFLSKDCPDETAHLLKLLGGLVVDGGLAMLHQGAQFGESFAGGLTGHGGRIDGAGHGELRSLRLWEFLEVPELRYNQVKVFVGIDWQCPGAGIIESVTPDVGENGALLSTGTAVLKLEEGQFGAIDVDDIAMGIYHFGNSQDATTDKDDSKGNFTFAGFATSYWRITSVDAGHKVFKYALRPGYSVHPQPQMTFACYGNFTKPERQTSTYRTRTYTRRLWKQNSWEIAKDNIAAQDGDLDNLSVHGLQLQGYSTYLDSIYFTGTIQHLKKPDGTTIHIVNERGKWEKDTQYDYYDRVSHNGSLWLCMNEKGTNSEPTPANPDWLQQVDKGSDGSDIITYGEWTEGLHVKKNGIVTMGGIAFIAKVDTDNPPMWNYTDDAGVRYITEDGYVLTSEYNTEEYMMLVESGTEGPQGMPGADGSDGANGLNGTSIVWKGTFDKHPLNPEDGWAYRNSADKKTYIYQDGQWYQMTIDGVDGQNGEPGKDGIGITWKGDLVSAPANPQKNWVYRDTDNGRVYIYNGTAWELMVVDGSDGIEGAPGQDGLSVYITYHDSVTAPLTPTGNGTTGGWHHNATASVRWMSQKVAASVETGTWGGPIEVKGKDGVDGQDGEPGPAGPQGDGFTHMGRWQSGMLVPKMGVVTMGGSSYVAKVATRNAPVSVYKDASGNGYIYADGGYVLTGDINTAEYDVLSEKGEDGLQGCIIRDSEWSSEGVQYRNDETLTSGTRFIDITLVDNPSNDVGYACYKCKVTHNSNSSNKPGTSGGNAYWELMSNVGPIFTSLLIAKNAKIKFLQGNQLLIQKSNGTVAAGISGSDAGDKTRFWAGSNTPDSAPFAVNEEGVATAERFRTGRTGCRIEAHNGVIDIFGDFARNIQFGVNEQGMAVLKYFDNNGNQLYDLGPGGISKMPIREESWHEDRWTFLDADLNNIFGMKWATACTPVSGSAVYRYSSKMVAGVLDDAANDGKYFSAKNKALQNLIKDGWYVQTLKRMGGVNGDYIRMIYNPGMIGSNIQLPSDMHPNNPSISTYEKIYINPLFLVSGGRIVKRQNIFYNLRGTII